MTKQEVLQAVMAKTAQWHYAIRYALRCKQAASTNTYGPAPSPNAPPLYDPPAYDSELTDHDRWQANNIGSFNRSSAQENGMPENVANQMGNAASKAFLDTRQSTIDTENMERLLRNPNKPVFGSQFNGVKSVFPYTQRRSNEYYEYPGSSAEMQRLRYGLGSGAEHDEFIQRRDRANKGILNN